MNGPQHLGIEPNPDVNLLDVDGEGNRYFLNLYPCVLGTRILLGFQGWHSLIMRNGNCAGAPWHKIIWDI